jgi:ribosomal protein S18 acetylase RimI-like enzyme
VIRRATVADAGTLSELGRSTFVEAFGHLYSAEDCEAFLSQAHSVEKYRSLLETPTNALWLALDEDGQALGYGVAGRCGLPVPELEITAGEIKRLYVKASAQGRQLGSQILELMLEWLRRQELEPLYVGVWSENRGAQRLYGRFGFRQVGEYLFPVGRTRDRELILKRPTPAPNA